MGFVREPGDSSALISKTEFIDCLYFMPDDNVEWQNHEVIGNREFVGSYYDSLSAKEGSICISDAINDFKIIAKNIITGNRVQRDSKADSDALNALLTCISCDTNLENTRIELEKEISRMDVFHAYDLANYSSIRHFLNACLVYSISVTYPTINVEFVSKKIGGLTYTIFNEGRLSKFINPKFGNEDLVHSSIIQIYKALVKFCICLLDLRPKFWIAEMASAFIINYELYKYKLTVSFAVVFTASSDNHNRLKSYIISCYVDTDNKNFKKAISKMVSKLSFDDDGEDKRPSRIDPNGKHPFGDYYAEFEYYQKDLEADVKFKTYYYPMHKDMLSKLDELKLKFPNFLEVIDFVKKNLMLNVITKGVFNLPPISIKGPAGCGKTLFAQSLAEVLKMSKLSIYGSQVTCGSFLVGLQRTWGSARAGVVSDHIYLNEIINPMVIFDDYEGMEKQYTNGINPNDALSRLIDKSQAKNFVDSYTLKALDLSKVSWIFIGSNMNSATARFRSMVKGFDIKPIDEDCYEMVIKSIYEDVLEANKLRKFISVDIEAISMLSLVKSFRHHKDVRKIKNKIDEAVIRYCEDNFDTLSDTKVFEEKFFDSGIPKIPGKYFQT